MNVLHDCPDGDCPYCVNPAHLWLGNDFENARDMFQKGRANPCGGIYPHGEEHHFAKLTQRDADAIRVQHRDGVGCIRLGRLFGVSKTTVMDIVHNKRYVQNTGI